MTSSDRIESAPSLIEVGNRIPLFVDLDGTLIKTDCLYEGFWAAVRKKPLECARASIEALQSRAKFKQKIAAIAQMDASLYPYRIDLVEFLRKEASAGRKLILATAADEREANKVARHLGIFSEVIASNGEDNRKGLSKLEAIREQAREFVYVGDSRADLPIWSAGVGAIVAGNRSGIRSSLERAGVPVLASFPSRSSRGQAMFRALRAHQWAKNLLVFLPILLGHRQMEVGSWTAAALVFIVFSLTASSIYIWNDLVDLEADRQHAKKSRRPFASGDLSITDGLLLSVALVAGAITVSLFLPAAAGMWIGFYFLAALFYSFYLKTKLLADVVGLAILYVLRVMAGGAATSIPISPWTLAFCLFFFYSLALSKRFGELRALPEGKHVAARRGYQVGDLQILGAIGSASGLLSIVVYALYISSPEVRTNNGSPELLWLATPVILYWLGRLWILTNRGVIAEDPLVFSLKDSVSHMAALIIAAVWLIASRSW